MARNPDQKLKLLYVKEFLENYSDEDNPVSTLEIINYLDSKGIKAERKSIYDDINCLTNFGMDIIQVRGRNGGYFLGERRLELHELKILIDAVLSSRFLTTKKTRDLIDKLAFLVPHRQRAELRRRVHVMSRLKSSNEQIYSNIDRIQSAFSKQKPISFYYTDWSIERAGKIAEYKRERRHNGALYEAYPIEVIWDNENYYLLAKSSGTDELRTYRLDRMQEIRVREEKDDPSGKIAANRFDPAVYSSSVFDMYDGDEKYCKLLFHKNMLSAILDRFGEDCLIVPAEEENWYMTNQVIRVSDRFFGWLLAFGDKVRLVGPTEVVLALQLFLRHVSAPYKIDEINES